MQAGPETSPPSTLNGRSNARRQSIVADCRSRLESVGDALRFLENHRPESAPSAAWHEAVADMGAQRMEIVFSLDAATAEFAPKKSAQPIMVLLADVKRLEGKLANLCARFECQLPVEF